MASGVAAYRNPSGQVTTISCNCTQWAHRALNNSEKTWDCPCHGSRFNPTAWSSVAGEVPLEKVDVHEEAK